MAEERQRRKDKRAIKVIESALTLFFNQVSFGANVFERGVNQIYFERDYKKRKKLNEAILHIKGRLDLSNL